jgi:hypothetical protein
MMSMTLDTLVRAASDLHGHDESVHPEYTRALVELVGFFLPGDGDNRKAYLYPLISGSTYEQED